MQRRALGVVLFCLFVLVAIAAGYWDMLASEKLRISQSNSADSGRDVATLSTRSDDLALPEKAGSSAGASKSESGGLPQGVARPQAEPVEAGKTETEQATTPSTSATDEPTSAATSQTPAGVAGEGGTEEAAANPPQSLPSAGDGSAPAAGKTEGVDAAPDGTAQSTASTETGDVAESHASADGGSQSSSGDAPAQENAKADPQPAPAETSDLMASGVAGPGTESEKPAAASKKETALPLASGLAGIGGDGKAAPRPEAKEPQFDLLRVEPDGSTVIAGRSTPGSKVMLRDGDRTIASDKANRDGEFAIVLDRPLAPGEHEIRIHSADDAGKTQVSREAAIVSVPETGRSDDLLAMVDSPDAPSKLVELPKARDAASAPAAEPEAKEPETDTAKADLPRASEPSGAAPAEAAPSSAGSDVVMLPRTSATESAPAGRVRQRRLCLACGSRPWKSTMGVSSSPARPIPDRPSASMSTTSSWPRATPMPRGASSSRPIIR